ncbi:hypothetical protein AXW83_13515 [Bosea sp. PAMC 26642]|nr:hypothetical protein AXW83_13515 [Bosea sp. PAMC 26642]
MVASALPASAQDAACRLDAVPCCDWPAKTVSAQPAPPAFGTQVWPATLVQSPASVDRLLALKPHHLRFSLGPSWRRQPALRQEMSDTELDMAVAAGFATMTNADRHAAVMRDIVARSRTKLHLIIWEPPPLPGEPDFTKPKAPTWRVMKPENVSLAARFYVAHLKAIAEAGVPLDAVELSNEPDGSWAIKILPADYLALVRAVRGEAKRRGVALPRIFGPGTGRIAEAQPFFRDKAIALGILDAVDVVSLHAWDDAAGMDRSAELDKLLARFAELGRKPEIAITEFGVGRPDILDKTQRMNARNRGDDNIGLTEAYAGYSTRDLMRLYAGKVGIVIQWEFQDQSWGKGSMGLLDVKGQEKPVYRAMRTLAERLDADRPDAIETSPDGRVALLRKAGRDSLIVSNPSREPLDIMLANRKPAASKPAAGIATCAGTSGTGLRLPAESVTAIPLAPH